MQKLKRNNKYIVGSSNPITTLTIVGVFLLISTVLLLNYRTIQDYIVIATNPTPEKTLQLVQRAGMNDNGQFYFKASMPKIAEAEEFNQYCRDNHDGGAEAVLGCYVSGRIFVYNIDDERLDGVKEVTAAHETLHAVYRRMPQSEKNYVNSLLEDEYQKIKDNEDIKKRMSYYNRSQPGELYNELHSIIGTEHKDISRSLEDYYSKYFADRIKSIELYAEYSTLMNEMDQEVEQLNAKLTQMQESIKPRLELYNKEKEVLSNDINQFNTWAESSSVKDANDFNNRRQALIDRSEVLNATQNKLNREIEEYNELIKKYNAAVWRSNDINKTLNSLESTPKLE